MKNTIIALLLFSFIPLAKAGNCIVENPNWTKVESITIKDNHLKLEFYSKDGTFRKIEADYVFDFTWAAFDFYMPAKFPEVWWGADVEIMEFSSEVKNGHKQYHIDTWLKYNGFDERMILQTIKCNEYKSAGQRGDTI